MRKWETVFWTSSHHNYSRSMVLVSWCQPCLTPVFSSYTIIDIPEVLFAWKFLSVCVCVWGAVIILVMWEVTMQPWLLTCRLSRENISLPHFGDASWKTVQHLFPLFRNIHVLLWPDANLLPLLSMIHWSLWLLIHRCPFYSQTLYCPFLSPLP